MLIAPAGLGPEINWPFLDGFLRARSAASLTPWMRLLVAYPVSLGAELVEAIMRRRGEGALVEAQARLAEALFPDGVQAFGVRLSVPTQPCRQRSSGRPGPDRPGAPVRRLERPDRHSPARRRRPHAAARGGARDGAAGGGTGAGGRLEAAPRRPYRAVSLSALAVVSSVATTVGRSSLAAPRIASILVGPPEDAVGERSCAAPHGGPPSLRRGGKTLALYMKRSNSLMI